MSFPDILQTGGQYQTRPELPFVLGWEASGTVRTDGVGFRAGDRVAALPVTGGFAQTVAADATTVLPLSDNANTRRGALHPARSSSSTEPQRSGEHGLPTGRST